MTTEHFIDVGRDFSRYPGGRYAKTGPFSGQEFREKYLVPHLRDADVLTVELSNVEGYSGSFLDESFAGLIRNGISEETLRKKLRLIGDEEFIAFVDRAWLYVSEEVARQKSLVGKK